jgi:DNA repair exonuclease SbcCD nuclease subunit
MKFIASSDKHLTLLLPRCRQDEDWLGTQKRLLQFIADEANKRKCPVFDLGDIFDTARVPSIIVSMFLEFAFSVNAGIRILAGNHSLLYHNIDNMAESSFGIIDKIVKSGDKRIQYFDDIGKYAHFNEELKGKETGLLFIHRLTFENSKTIPPNVNAVTANDLLNEYPNAKWIFTGDMHRSFIYERKGRTVCNPGAMYRGSVDEKEYSSSIYYVDTDKGTIEQIFIPDDEKIIDDSYIIERDEKENRISAFVEKLRNNESVNLDFLENIENGLLANKKLSKDTVKMIRFLCEEKEEK